MARAAVLADFSIDGTLMVNLGGGAFNVVDVTESPEIKIVGGVQRRYEDTITQVVQDDKIRTKAAIDLATPYADDNAAKTALTEDGIVNVGGVTKLYDAESDTLSELAATVEDVDQFYASLADLQAARTAATDKTPFELATGRFGVLADDGSYKVYRWNPAALPTPDFEELANTETVPTTTYAITVDINAAFGSVVALQPGATLEDGQNLLVSVKPGAGQVINAGGVTSSVGTVRESSTAGIYIVEGINADATITVVSANEIVVSTLDAGIAWQAGFDYSSATNKIFTFVPVSDVTVDGKDLTGSRTYLAKYTADATSDAADIANDYANLTIIGDANEVPSDKTVDVLADTAFVIATTFAEETSVYLLRNTSAAPINITSDATVQNVDDVATTPWAMPANSEAIAIRVGTVLEMYPFDKSTPTGFADQPETEAGTVADKAVAPDQLAAEITRRFGTLFARLGITFDTTDWGVFTGTTITDNSASLIAILQELETKVETIQLEGDFRGPSAATIAALVDPTTVDNADWTVLTAQDGVNPPGIYVSDTVAWSLLMEVSPAVTLTLAEMVQFAGATEYDAEKAGLMSVRGLDDFRLSREALTPMPLDNRPLPGRYLAISGATTLDGTGVAAGGTQSYYLDLPPNTNLTVPGIAVAISHEGPNNETIHLQPHPTNNNEFVVKNRNGASTPSAWVFSTDNMNAADGDKIIVQPNHSINFPGVADLESVQLAPSTGNWSDIAAGTGSFTPDAAWTFGLNQSLLFGSDIITAIANLGSTNWLLLSGGEDAPSQDGRFETVALLPAPATLNPGSAAYVYDDGANNGAYVLQGPTGGPSTTWVRS